MEPFYNKNSQIHENKSPQIIQPEQNSQLNDSQNQLDPSQSPVDNSQQSLTRNRNSLRRYFSQNLEDKCDEQKEFFKRQNNSQRIQAKDIGFYSQKQPSFNIKRSSNDVSDIDSQFSPSRISKKSSNSSGKHNSLNRSFSFNNKDKKPSNLSLDVNLKQNSPRHPDEEIKERPDDQIQMNSQQVDRSIESSSDSQTSQQLNLGFLVDEPQQNQQQVNQDNILMELRQNQESYEELCESDSELDIFDEPLRPESSWFDKKTDQFTATRGITQKQE